MLTFPNSSEDLLATCHNLIQSSRKRVDEIIAASRSSPTFNEVIRPLAMLEAKLWQESTPLTFPQYVSEDKQIRAAAAEATQLLQDFKIEKSMNKQLYEAVKAVKAGNEELQGEEARLLEKMLFEFERNGLQLPEGEMEELAALKKKLSELGIKFSSNMNEDKTQIEFTKEELDGCKDDFLESLARANEKYIVTMKYPDVLGVLKYCKKEETRKAVSFANGARLKENIAILEEAIEIRKKCAHLMKFKNHAQFQLIETMAKTPETVLEFLTTLRGKLVPLAQKEIVKLISLKKAEKQTTKEETLNAWDTQYYSRILLETEYAVDEEKIKEYFSFESVTKEMLNIYETILGLKFEKIANNNGWNADVKLIKVSNASDGNLVGHLYLDLFPRDGKYTHAACFDLIPGYEMMDGSRNYPICAIVANFGKPTSTKPSLLTENEVVTYFHELGHAMHQLCAHTKFSRFHGTNVETDFVEAPSQMLENWCYNPQALKKLSKHYLNEEPLPSKYIEALINAKNVNAGLHNLRQIFFGIFDMTIHSSNDKVDVISLWSQLKSEITMISDHPGTHAASTFGHMMGGYDAGYYGYLWSQVFSADMFYTRFHKEGVDNVKTGAEYRRCILKPGGSKDAMDMIKDFLGRAPTQEAFLKSIGLF